MTLLEAALVLVIGCIGEISFPEHPYECRVMWHVQGAKVGYHRAATARQVMHYNSVFKVNSYRTRWVRNLKLDGSRPKGLKDSTPWTTNIRGRSYSRRDSVLRIAAAAFKFLKNRDPHPCPEAKHYGGRCERKRGACDVAPECSVRVDCGDTEQAYYFYQACKAKGRKQRAKIE